jgi:hypothetical protein
MPGSANGSFVFNSNDKLASYNALVGKVSAGGAGSKCGGKTYVVPKDPNSSLLYQKLLATVPCGMRMPMGGMVLTDPELQTISAWITAGAQNN